MGTCRSEKDLESYAAGTATPGQVTAWKAHLKAWDACAARWVRRQGELDESTGPAPDARVGQGVASRSAGGTRSSGMPFDAEVAQRGAVLERVWSTTRVVGIGPWRRRTCRNTLRGRLSANHQRTPHGLNSWG